LNRVRSNETDLHVAALAERGLARGAQNLHRLLNAGISLNIIAPGLTIASENPVYIQGDFNATAASANVEPNVATAVLGDAVTLLSNSWNDIRSFNAPSDSTQRRASTTGYRVAIVTGKTRAFPKPSFTPATFGSDGGANNFVRLLEDWNDPSVPWIVCELLLQPAGDRLIQVLPQRCVPRRSSRMDFRHGLPGPFDVAARDADVPRRQYADLPTDSPAWRTVTPAGRHSRCADVMIGRRECS
jgi:hypothetical protein